MDGVHDGIRANVRKSKDKVGPLFARRVRGTTSDSQATTGMPPTPLACVMTSSHDIVCLYHTTCHSISTKVTTPVCNESARSAALCELVLRLVNDSLVEYSYAAYVAELHYDLKATDMGFEVHFFVFFISTENQFFIHGEKCLFRPLDAARVSSSRVCMYAWFMFFKPASVVCMGLVTNAFTRVLGMLRALRTASIFLLFLAFPDSCSRVRPQGPPHASRGAQTPAGSRASPQGR